MSKASNTISTNTLDDWLTSDTITLDVSGLENSLNFSDMSFTSGTAGATGSTGNFIWTTNNTGPSFNSNYYSIGSVGTNSQLHVKGDAEFEGDIKIKGRSVAKTLDKIADRLAILEDPDPKKLEKYAALKKAYENYKMLERLIGNDADDSTEK